MFCCIELILNFKLSKEISIRLIKKDDWLYIIQYNENKYSYFDFKAFIDYSIKYYETLVLTKTNGTKVANKLVTFFSA